MEYAPCGPTLTGPLGCTSQYESCTAKAVVLGLIPDKLSDIVPETVTVTIFPFGGQRVAGLAEAVITGGVWSMLIPLTVAEPEFPATSRHVPVTDWFAPSAESVVGAGGLPAARPERLSAQWKLTVTFVLFHPFAFGAGEAEPVIFGGVLSRRMINAFGASALPALSVPKNIIVVMPSVLMVKEVDEPATTVLAMVWAPLAL